MTRRTANRWVRESASRETKAQEKEVLEYDQNLIGDSHVQVLYAE